MSQLDKEDKKLTKKQKIWILGWSFGGIIGVVISLLSQLIYKKKKGQFKFILLGYMKKFLILSGLISFFISGEVPYGLDEIGDIFILS